MLFGARLALLHSWCFSSLPVLIQQVLATCDHATWHVQLLSTTRFQAKSQALKPRLSRPRALSQNVEATPNPQA